MTSAGKSLTLLPADGCALVAGRIVVVKANHRRFKVTTKKNVSLLDYARQFEKIACFACEMPEREEMDGAYRSGVDRKTILKWLWEAKGYSDKSTVDEDRRVTGISASMLDKHFTGQHHFKKEQ